MVSTVTAMAAMGCPARSSRLVASSYITSSSNLKAVLRNPCESDKPTFPTRSRRMVVGRALLDRNLTSNLQFNANYDVTVDSTSGNSAPELSLDAYMRQPSDILSFIPLPAGASLRPLAPEDTFELVVPELSLYSLWIRPICTVVVTKSPTEPRLVLQSRGVDIRGSEALEKFGINDKVDLVVRGRPRLRCNASMTMWMDPPGQFRLIPKGVLQSAGDVALQSSLSMLVKDFTSNIAKDFDRWSMDGQFRALRAMELQSLGHQRVPAMALESQDWD